MFRVSDLIDLPILTLMEGNCNRHTVKSLLVDGNQNKIVALVCKEGTLKKSFRIIPYAKIVSIDTNGIIIRDARHIKKINYKEANNYLALDDIINKVVKNNDGELYGVLTDIYINPLNGKITGYELSEGYIDDIVNGRRMIDISETLNNTLQNKEIILYQRLN